MKQIVSGGDKIIALVEEPSTEIVVYTQAWHDDHAVEGDEKAHAQLHGRIFIDGHEIVMATGLTLKVSGSDFMQADIHVCPSTVKLVPLNAEDWEALGK